MPTVMAPMHPDNVVPSLNSLLSVPIPTRTAEPLNAFPSIHGPDGLHSAPTLGSDKGRVEPKDALSFLENESKTNPHTSDAPIITVTRTGGPVKETSGTSENDKPHKFTHTTEGVSDDPKTEAVASDPESVSTTLARSSNEKQTDFDTLRRYHS